MTKWTFRSSLLCAFIILPGIAVAADDGPEPTTSPTTSRSGTLIQTDTIPEGKGKSEAFRAGLKEFTTARRQIIDDVARINRLSRSGKLTPRQVRELRKLSLSVRQNADTVAKYARRSKNKSALDLANRIVAGDDAFRKFIINDDILGRSPQMQRQARVLDDLSSKLGRLEPSVAR